MRHAEPIGPAGRAILRPRQEAELVREHNKKPDLTGEIRSAGYAVRYHNRPAQAQARAAAVRRMGEAARAAFNASDDFEEILFAIADSLYPFEASRDDRRRR